VPMASPNIAESDPTHRQPLLNSSWENCCPVV
jgi:hypothetical protein